MVPGVSIVIPCYNASQFIETSVGSVFTQTFTDFEVILINDGSTDTRELKRALQPWFGRIVYIETENHGPSSARNTGIQAARSELVAFLDADDAWEPNYLEVQLRQLEENPSADIVYARVIEFGDDLESPRLRPADREEVTFISLVEERCSVSSSVLARRAVLQRAGMFDPAFNRSEDFDLWLRCLKAGGRIIHHPQQLVRYRRRGGSLSSDTIAMSEGHLRVLDKMRTSVPLTAEERRVVESAIPRVEARKLLSESRQFLAACDLGSAIRCMEEANARLHSNRLRLRLLFMRTMPWLALRLYQRRSRYR